MPDITGFEYAHGVYEIKHGEAASAYSKGWPLVFTSVSSLSGADVLFPASGASQILGVALSSSTESYRNLSPYVVATSETVFWASLESTLTTSTRTEGELFDIGLNTAGTWSVQSSQLSARVVLVDTSEIATHSDNSYVLVKFLTAGAQTVEA